jgi:hypothetical protein
MFVFTRANAMALALAGALLAGCAGDGSDIFSTGALGTASADANVDPQCVTLATRIEGLRKEGIADKIEKAAAKKYKMTQTDLAKADQLTKANADFQLRCSTIMPSPVTAEPAPAAAPAAPKASAKPAKKEAAAPSPRLQDQ